MIGNEEGTGGSSTLNRTPSRPPESRRGTGTNHRPAAPTRNPYPRRRTPDLSPPVTHIHAGRPCFVPAASDHYGYPNTLLLPSTQDLAECSWHCANGPKATYAQAASRGRVRPMAAVRAAE